MNKHEQEFLPVSHYELLGVNKHAPIGTILPKYRLLVRFWQMDNAKKWASSEDFASCEKISERLGRAYVTLCNDRGSYDLSILAATKQALTPEELEFRLLWDRMKIRYRHKLANLRLLQPFLDSNTFAHQWHVPKEMIMELYKWVGRRDRSRSVIVSKETEHSLNTLAFEQYCDFIHQQLKKVDKLTDQNCLTVSKLKQHWQFGDRLLRLLINFRVDDSYKNKLSSWYDTLLATIHNPNENTYLQNPYLRDLVIALIIKQWDISKASTLTFLSRLNFEDLDDPSAIFLYAKIVIHVASVNNQVKATVLNALKKYCSVIFSPKFLTPINEVMIMCCLYQCYLRPEVMVPYLKKVSTFSSVFSTMAHRTGDPQTFIKIPSIAARNWILSCDRKKFFVVLREFSMLFQEDFDVHFWDDLCRQLKEMTESEIETYLFAYRFTVGGFPLVVRLHRKRAIEICQKLPLIPVAEVKEILKTANETFEWLIPQKRERGREAIQRQINLGKMLRLALNTGTKHVTIELLNEIFNSDDKFQHHKKNDDVIDNLETLAVYIDEQCLNFITTPTNAMGRDDQTLIITYLKETNGKEFYFCLNALRELTEYELTFLLTEKMLGLSELMALSKKERRRFFDILSIIPVEQLTGAMVDTLYCSLPQLHLDEYRRLLQENQVEMTSEFELVRFMLLKDSAALIQSSACLQLMTKIGLANFNRCSVIYVNYFCLINYLDAVFNRAPEKLPGLIDVIYNAFESNAYERLADLVSAYLSPPAAADKLTQQENDAAIGEKRVRTENSDLPLAKLYCAAEKDPELERRILEEGERYSSAFDLKR